MRVPSYHDRSEPRDDQSMTSMIDVVFLLLIFFVCASVGQVVESILPTPLAVGSIESTEPVEVEEPLGRVWLNLRHLGDETIVQVNDEREFRDFSQLEATLTELASLAPEIPVILDIDSDVPLGEVIRVYDVCRAAEFDNVQFATEPNSRGENQR